MPGAAAVKGETVGADPRLSGWNASAEEDPARYRVLNSPKTSRQVQAEWMRRWVGNQRGPAYDHITCESKADHADFLFDGRIGFGALNYNHAKLCGTGDHDRLMDSQISTRNRHGRINGKTVFFYR
jgi:hypothetical protein